MGLALRFDLLVRAVAGLYLGGSAMVQTVPGPRVSLDGETATPDDMRLEHAELAFVEALTLVSPTLNVSGTLGL